jgi:hypothetical protein
MIKLFQGVYDWKMPADVHMPVGTPWFDNAPKTWMAATEKYSSQVRMEVTPAGHHILRNYYGGTPFPESSGPRQGLEDPGERHVGRGSGDVRQHS